MKNFWREKAMGRVRNSVRNKRGSFVATKVVGVRAEEEFWEMAERVAVAEGKTRNGLIVELVSEYCEKGGGGVGKGE